MSRLHLPPLLQDIAEVAGLAAAWQLAEAKGGQRVFIPQKPMKWVQDLLGSEAAVAICSRFGGMEYDIPTMAFLNSIKAPQKNESQ